MATVTLEEIEQALHAKGVEPSAATRAQLVALCGVTDNQAKTWQRHLRKGQAPTRAPEEQHEQKGDTWQISLPKTRIHTLEQLLEHAKVDLTIWTVERFIVNKWEMGSVDKEGEPQTTPLYQVKAWLKRNVVATAVKAEIEQLKLDAKRAARSYPALRRPKSTGYMLELSIPDLHVGKMAWGKETGYEDYDIKLAKHCFEQALTALIERTSSYRFDQVLLVLGNDLLHTDNRQGATEAGTAVDTDGRYHKAFYETRLMVTDAIERLRGVAPVMTKMVPGNHDYLSTWHLGDSLECTFAKCKDVTIDNAPTGRKYHQFGRVMLMFAHGNKGKLADYPLVMATEQPTMFGATQHREAHTGDKHTTRVHEYHGVKVRISPALCASDSWHSENLFVGNARSAEAFVWHQDEGLVGTAVFTVLGERV